jgi:hypothetical protein
VDMFEYWHTYDTAVIHLPHESKQGADDDELLG